MRSNTTKSEKPLAKPIFGEEDYAVGAAMMLTYLRDLITLSSRDEWDRPSLLVLLETVSEDAELFPCGTGTLIWQSDAEDGAA